MCPGELSIAVANGGGPSVRRPSPHYTCAHASGPNDECRPRTRAGARVLNGAAAEQHPSMVVHAGEKKRTCSKYMKHTTPVFKIATS